MPRYTDPERQKLFIQRAREGRKGKCMGDTNPSRRPEVRAKISQKNKGRVQLSTQGEKNPAKRTEIREKIRNNENSQKGRFKKGHTPHNFGRTKENYEPTRIDAEKRKERKNTAEQRQHIKDNLPPDHKEKARQNALNNIKNGKFPRSARGKAEMQFLQILKEILLIENKDFQHQYIIGKLFIVDFYIYSSNLVIEVDGVDHKHSRRERERDLWKERYLREYNYNLIRITNDEIFNEKNKVKTKVLKYIYDYML